MNYKLIFKTALLAGEIMLKNGAETYRVEDTINRILNTTKFQVIDSFVTPTGIFATLDDPSIEMITLVRRVDNRTTHLHKVAQTNNISRLYVEEKISIEDAYIKLKQVTKEPPYTNKTMIISYGLAAGFFSLVFGGNLKDFSVSIIIGFILGFNEILLSSLFTTHFLIDLIGGCLIGILSILFTNIIPLGNDINIIIVGSIMPLVPGLAITNAIRDTLQGDLVSGISRAVEAFFIAVSIAVGVGVILKLYFIVTGGSAL